MRRLGYLVVDTLVEQFETLPARNPSNKGDRAKLDLCLCEPLPAGGADPRELIDFLKEHVFGNAMAIPHPRFFAFVPGPSNFVSVMADALASGFNPFVGTWLAGSGPAALELATVAWLREICGLPECAGGLFLSGGSMANMTALAVARHVKLGERFENARIYCSDQTHASIDRATRVLGFRRDQLRRLPSDAQFRLPLAELERAVAEDGGTPFCVVANAGTTNTGAVDPLAEVAQFCRERGLWLHVDGAYGAAAMLSASGRASLRGLELADSVSLDPHKWLFQPFEMGCILVRDRALLRDTFRILPDYLRDVHRLKEEVNFCDHGIQLTRSFRALKLWMSLKVFGVDAFREAVEWGLHLAEFAEAKLRAADAFEVLSPAQMAIVAFRYRAGSEEETERINREIVPGLMADGYAMLSSTTLRGKTILRLCTINPRTTEEEIEETVRRIGKIGRSLR